MSTFNFREPGEFGDGATMTQTPTPTAIDDMGAYLAMHQAAIDAYEAATPADYRYSAIALRKAVDAAVALSRRSLDTADGVERNADIEKIAWNCSDWPKWLGDEVERAMAVSDDLDMSTEQVLAYAILASRTPNTEMVVKDRDALGRRVREAWVKWALMQPNPKPSWLVPYDELSEPDKEADRQIGEALASPPSPAEVTEPEPVAWQWSDFSGNWYTVDTNLSRMSLSEQEGIAIACAAAHAGRVRPLYASPPAQEAVTDAMVDASLRGWYSPDYDPAKLSPSVLEYHRSKARAALTEALQLGKEG